MSLPVDTGYAATAEDRASLDAWFAAYDAHSAACRIEEMADMAAFPLNLVSDDSQGNGRSAQWDRRQFVDTMKHVMGDAGEDVSFRSTRTPVFLSAAMAVVFTDCTMTVAGEARRMHYADVLIRKDGTWAFQTMIQGGWGDSL
ncbi:nuclear transport factor 2 family protein [Streptomyces sp. NPDC012888]|uniref:nuclear transport factor 2 family protein n=1 Tax=Streptomyces sp. NPDC012888 TaxID=3364855 RepID=UPI0036C780EA